jgi:alpha 1,3-glucosidase
VAFLDPEAIQRKIGADRRRMATNMDPRIKCNNHYCIHKKDTAMWLYIKDKKSTKNYDGWCWPGLLPYLDFI